MPWGPTVGPIRQWWDRVFAWATRAAAEPAFSRVTPALRDRANAAAGPVTRQDPAETTASPAPASRTELTPPIDSSLRAATLGSLAQLQQIPALQSLAQGFVRAANRSDASIDEVVHSVEKDPSLCIRVLKMANSAYVSPAQPIDDIFTAVQMLGLRRVGTLAHLLFTMRDTRSMAGGLNWRHLWVHSLATASIAEELDRKLGAVAGPQLYLAALLHDVGKIVLSTVEPEKYQGIFAAVLREAVPLGALELAQLGVGHAEAGVVFGRQSGLPDEVVAAIAWHEAPQKAETYCSTVAVVSLANYLSKYYGLGFGGNLLKEADGEWETHPAWSVLDIPGQRDCDRLALGGEMRDFVGGLKQDLLDLREVV